MPNQRRTKPFIFFCAPQLHLAKELEDDELEADQDATEEEEAEAEAEEEEEEEVMVSTPIRSRSTPAPLRKTASTLLSRRPHPPQPEVEFYANGPDIARSNMDHAFAVDLQAKMDAEHRAAAPAKVHHTNKIMMKGVELKEGAKARASTVSFSPIVPYAYSHMDSSLAA